MKISHQEKRKNVLKSLKFGYYDECGNAVPFWQPENEYVDSDGFDKRNITTSGFYKEEVILPKGKLISRYGNVRGRLSTDYGEDYDKLGLPYVKETVEYHTYKVIADGLKVICNVQKGRVAPMFDSPGGATQYKHYSTIAEEISNHKIKEVFI